MKTRYTLDPLTGEFKDRHGNSLGVLQSITIDLAPGALEDRRAEALLRKKLWERAGYACERCRKGAYEAWLQMHHRTYERLGHERLEDVELLCRDCHKAEHARLTAAGTPLRRPNRNVGDGRSTSEPSTALAEGQTAKQDEGAGETKPTRAQLERAAVERVWDHWLRITGKRQRLDSKRERIVRNAIKLVGEEATTLALTGLSRSPHHLGQNEQRKTYMEIRYALKGRGDESDDERIEKAITWAAQYAPEAAEVEPEVLQRWLDDVRYTLSLEHRPERERAKESYRKLAAAGFKVVQLDKPPWARIER